MAEQNIVDGLQNLRVVAAYDLAVMDDLARDFANALEDFPMTVRLRSGCNEQVRRRRFRKRRQKGTLPIFSESDSDHEKMMTNHNFGHRKVSESDSDDLELFARPKYSLSRFPAISAPLLVESDSVTDCLPQNPPPRRRRFLKKMNADDDTKLDMRMELPIDERVILSKDLKCKIRLFSDITSSSCCGHPSLPSCAKKRKRSVRESKTCLDACEINVDVEGGSGSSGRILSPCSCKSEAENSAGDGREGDDEQSDFYFESDQSYPQQLGECETSTQQLPFSSTSAKLTGSDKQSNGVRKSSGRQREMIMRRDVSKNQMLRSFLDEKVQISSSGRLFIPAKRRLVNASKSQHDGEELEVEAGVVSPLFVPFSTSHHLPTFLQSVSHLSTPTPLSTSHLFSPPPALSSPPLHGHKRHKCCHVTATEADDVMQAWTARKDQQHPGCNESKSSRSNRKKRLFNFVSGLLR